MLEVRTAKYKASKDDAVVLRCGLENSSYYSYRLFHAGMATPVPIANGGWRARGPGEGGTDKSGRVLRRDAAGHGRGRANLPCPPCKEGT